MRLGRPAVSKRNFMNPWGIFGPLMAQGDVVQSNSPVFAQVTRVAVGTITNVSWTVSVDPATLGGASTSAVGAAEASALGGAATAALGGAATEGSATATGAAIGAETAGRGNGVNALAVGGIPAAGRYSAEAGRATGAGASDGRKSTYPETMARVMKIVANATPRQNCASPAARAGPAETTVG